MYNMDKEKLNSIIEKSHFSSDDEKDKQIRNAFLAFISELIDYSKSVNDRILKQSTFPISDGILPEICISFMDREKGDKVGKSLGLDFMAEGGDRKFIDDEYENVKNLIGDEGARKDYEGQYIKDGKICTFKYYLKFDRSYVERQELLYRYSLYYDIINPVIYSPYSYKAVTVVYDYGIDKYTLDFRFKENGINIVDSKDKDLFWNISISNESRTYDAKIPYGDETRYVFEFSKSKKGNYVLPLPLNNQTQILDVNFTESGIEITTNHDMEEFVKLEPLVLDETSAEIKALKSMGMIFTNRINYNGIVNKRIVSEADIEHSIAMFRSNNGIKCHISKGEGDIIKRYAVKFRPNRNDRKLFSTISREYVFFEHENPIRFLTDYVNYVIEYLEYYYPEVEWAGEK
jgi:hypothetical protein